MIMLYDEVCKESPRAEALKEIRRFTDKEEPQLIRLLARTVDDMQDVVTYKTIRDALLSGSISQSALSAIQLAYTNFVAHTLVEMWDKAFQSAGRDLEKRRQGFVYNPSNASMDQWTQNRAADFVTNCTKETIAGVRAAVRRSVYHEAMGVDELAQAIRPMVGLNLPQVKANQNYFNLLIKNGVSKKRATEMAQKYAERQHRYRAQMIARTESAMAYNSMRLYIKPSVRDIWELFEKFGVPPTMSEHATNAGRLTGRKSVWTRTSGSNQSSRKVTVCTAFRRRIPTADARYYIKRSARQTKATNWLSLFC